MEKKILSQGPSELPPSGFKRDEELKIREDVLEQKAEELSAKQEVYAIDPKAFKIENEIASRFNALEVSNADPGYRYCWVNYGGNGRYVQYKLSRRIQGHPCWEVVRGEMPEATEVKAADGTRRIGDVLLMRCRKEYADLLDQMAQIRLRKLEGSVTTDLEDVADRASSYGARVLVGEEVPEYMLRRMHQKAQSRRTGQRMMDQWIKQGRVPGAAINQ